MYSTGGFGRGCSFRMSYGYSFCDIFVCIVSFYNPPQARMTEVGLFYSLRRRKVASNGLHPVLLFPASASASYTKFSSCPTERCGQSRIHPDG